jgi:hypothetical protein
MAIAATENGIEDPRMSFERGQILIANFGMMILV